MVSRMQRHEHWSDAPQAACNVLTLAAAACCRCAVCSEALRMEAAGAYSHRADKVSGIVPLAPTSADALLLDPLSRAAVLV